MKLIEQISDKGRSKLEFDIPFEGLDFYGCPHKSVVKVRPTKNCLIAISEFPFFVIDIDDIEVVHFERLSFGIKNFDMAIILKDFTTFKRINSVPVEHIEDIKSYFDEIGIIYSESLVPMNWNNVLAQIREDFEAFLGEGAWKFLQDDVSTPLVYPYRKKKAAKTMKTRKTRSSPWPRRKKKRSALRATSPRATTTMTISPTPISTAKPTSRRKASTGNRWSARPKKTTAEPPSSALARMCLCAKRPLPKGSLQAADVD